MSSKKETILLTKDINDIFVDQDKLVYSYNNHQIIGHYKDTENGNRKYIIYNKEYTIDHKTKMFITDKIETKRRHFIHNLNGDYIGFSKIELLKNRNKFYKKNTNIHYDITTWLIYHNNDNIIGKIIYDIDDAKITDTTSLPDILEVNYDCNPFVVENTNDIEIDDTSIDLNVNCMNVYFNLDYKINRQRLYEKIIDCNYICKYKPESYSGIKMIYKIPFQKQIQLENRGICKCSNKCTCTNITFLIFQSGNVIATGFKSNDQIELAVQDFLSLCNKFKKNIQKRLFSTWINFYL